MKLYLWLNCTIHVDGSEQTLEKIDSLIRNHVKWCGDHAEPGVVVWMPHGLNLEPKPFYRTLADWPWTPDQLRDTLGKHAIHPDNIVIYYGTLRSDPHMHTLATVNARASWFDAFNEMTKPFENFAACWDAAITYEGIAAERLKRWISQSKTPTYVESWNGCERWRVPGVTMAVEQYIDKIDKYPAGSLAAFRGRGPWNEEGIRARLPLLHRAIQAGHHPIVRSWMYGPNNITASEVVKW